MIYSPFSFVVVDILDVPAPTDTVAPGKGPLSLASSILPLIVFCCAAAHMGRMKSSMSKHRVNFDLIAFIMLDFRNYKKIFIGLRPHFKHQAPAIHQLFMREPWGRQLLSIHRCPLDIFIHHRTMIGCQRKLFPALEVDRYFTKQGATDRIDRQPWRDGIKTHGRKYNERAHTAAVLIARNTENIILEP